MVISESASKTLDTNHQENIMTPSDNWGKLEVVI